MTPVPHLTYMEKPLYWKQARVVKVSKVTAKTVFVRVINFETKNGNNARFDLDTFRERFELCPIQV